MGMRLSLMMSVHRAEAWVPAMRASGKAEANSSMVGCSLSICSSDGAV